MLIVGKLTVSGTVHGIGEPGVLTVSGEVSTARATMERQFIMQFLGGGTLAGAGSKLKSARSSITDEPQRAAPTVRHVTGFQVSMLDRTPDLRHIRCFGGSDGTRYDQASD